MNCFKSKAKQLGITPPELLHLIIDGKFSQSRETTAIMVEQMMERYTNFGILPDYVLEYCTPPTICESDPDGYRLGG